MASDPDPLTAAERDRLAAIRGADSLAELVAASDAEGAHDAYFEAKADWRELRGRELAAADDDGPAGERGPVVEDGGVPGARVTVDGTTVHVHGVTHADTDAERAFLREHLVPRLDAGASVYCEQGIRRMYFDDVEGVCAMDDYRWAMARCRELDVESTLAEFPGTPIDQLVEDVGGLAAQFREAAFSLIHDNRDVYGDEFAAALGDVAAAFLMSHENVGTGRDFESFARSRRAAEAPADLAALQRYYERAFLPQPLEREWLRRHDPELELVTHARNARMADYALAHAADDGEVHLVVGAAHQPGVRYYLERFRDGERDLEGFELA